MSINTFQLFTSTQPQLGANPFMCQMDTVMFCQLVASACWQMDRLYNPNSKEYIDPTIERRLQWENTNISYFRNNQSVPHIAESGVTTAFTDSLFKIILSYVEYKNKESQCIVGENYLYMNVYLIMFHQHNWIVRFIEKEHQENGKHFGSVLQYQKESVFELVKDWPEKFNFNPGTLPELLVLPSKRPGYYD